MKCIKTVKFKIKIADKSFSDTISIYNKALSYIINAIENEWVIISTLSTEKEQLNYIEKLIHGTKKNKAKYDFDSRFYKFPSYLRRAASSEALGAVKSYHSNLNNYLNKKAQYEAKGKTLRDKPPTLGIIRYSFPVFYKGNMFERTGNNTAKIKVYKNNDWVWHNIKFKTDNLKNRDMTNFKEMNPSLVKSGKKYYLYFTYEKEIKFKNTPLKDRTIISVDLGLTNSAVCSAMKYEGTVIGRLFINQPIEKDRLFHKINKLAKTQRISGNGRKPNIWRKINNIKNQIINDTVHQIIEFAKSYDADVIVFEHLGKLQSKGNYARRTRIKLQFWAKQTIQKKVYDIAHSYGIRVSWINPKNSSALAFDGTGKVVRNNKKDICEFTTGKKYHADLNASYNIGARYFIREILNPLVEKKRLQYQAKVPEIAARSQQTLSTLISLVKAMQSQCGCVA
ncbi:transposase, IS605 OrfB family [Thermoanaerobacterium thermosaccharolyticum DSM 571]|jgi:putative transposase|uniref:Transposase, IS605 OrfB family n=1 Tax=Thermoanaerobacterium thermosaccharolyticum (strain ATCC 7956 / DSM 571 / NCIMB 9385 / NCA 3814 / NCTC 13789 / WDCM 00135 / 2032) TaxID=580327 RepID=D9TMK1_THETC|nr:RNA-guided endonuclease TnpB family protein [Thermoanaerobacterium thermosaccharolyticum]ADL68489.1 transposase, IS605 OrfB family [Thermoanaerobacterium thermosaccharolyticum DSM 571]